MYAFFTSYAINGQKVKFRSLFVRIVKAQT